jgi:hypothetical protein
VKKQEHGKGGQPRFVSGHVAQATGVHEQVTKEAPSISEASKEATGQP